MAWGSDAPFLTRLAIRRWQARFPHWPPKSGSPATPIEPWGKTFFVYNAPAGVEFLGDPRAPPSSDIRPAWVRDEDRVSMLRHGERLETVDTAGVRSAASSSMSGLVTSAAADNIAEHEDDLVRRRASDAAEKNPGTETLLCATDFRKRPMLYLSPVEWAEFVRKLPELREELQACQAGIDARDEKGAYLNEYFLRRKTIPDKYDMKKIGRTSGGNARGIIVTGRQGPRARARIEHKSSAAYLEGINSMTE